MAPNGNSTPSNGSNGWIPTDKIKTFVYIVDKVGMLALVVIFLLGQTAGWIPSMAQSDHATLKEAVRIVGSRVNDNAEQITRTELAALRTQALALQICVELYKKEDQYKCLKPYEN